MEDIGADAFGLEQPDDGLHEAVVIGVADGDDQGTDALDLKIFGETHRGVRRTGVRETDQLTPFNRVGLAITLTDRHTQRDIHQLGLSGGRRVPTDDLLGEDIDDERHVGPSRPGAHVGEVRDPDTIRRIGGEVPVQQISGTDPVLGGDRGADALASAHTGQPQATHTSIHRTSGSPREAAPYQGGHLPPVVEALRSELGGAMTIGREGHLPIVAFHRCISDRAGSDVLVPPRRKLRPCAGSHWSLSVAGSPCASA